MKNLNQIFLILSIALLLLSGCQKSSPPDEAKTPAPTATIKELALHNKPVLNNGTYEAETSEYKLGKKEYVASSGTAMRYEIRGIIGVPKGDGPFPLILISHGSHSNDDESLRFDTGFNYLVQHLAEHGYIAVAMDMSKPYIWKYGDNDDREKSIPVANDHIEGLFAANTGESSGFSMNLKDKIDTNKIAFIGHSRGGETAFDIANDQAQRGRPFKAILSIAPTYFIDHDWPDTDVALLIPEYDGDVISLDGYNTFRAVSEKGGNFYSVTQLMKANHNYFNRNIERNDAGCSYVENATENQLSRDRQERFLMDFATDFFDASLKGIDGAFIVPGEVQPNTMYGFDITAMYQSSKGQLIADANSSDRYTATGATIKPQIDSWFYKHDEVLIETVTIGEEQLMTRALMNMKWEQKGAEVKIQPEITDFSGFEAVTINAVIDSADEINPRDISQRFSVILRDTRGNSSSLTLPEGLHALAYSPGKIDSTSITEQEIYYWSRNTPLAGINLPLEEFQHIDLANIESISLLFDQTEQGSIYVESVWLN